MAYKRLHRYQEALDCFAGLSKHQYGDDASSLGGNLAQLCQKLDLQRATLSSLRQHDCYTAEHAAVAHAIGVTRGRIYAASSLSVLWYEIAHTHELQAKYFHAKLAYEKVLVHHPRQAQALHKLGWIYQNVPRVDCDVNAIPQLSIMPKITGGIDETSPNATMATQRLIAISYLERSVAADEGEHAVWYLLGCCYAGQKEYKKAYWALQQAVTLNSFEPTYWGSIGNLYYFNSQYHEALDTYARALQLNPDCAEMW